MGAERVGPYELVSSLGRGGAGAVHRAIDSRTGAVVALKLLAPGWGETSRQRFAREARALTQLDHPSVVRVLDAGEERGAPWLAIELVEGESLRNRLERDGPLPVDEALSIAADLARALAHCHGRGVLHRDLKPDNVLLRRADRRALLVDFGLTREVDPSDGRTQLTEEGAFLGTPGYWSPEQTHGRSELVGPATDVYGLAATLHAALTGSPPHDGASVSALLLQASEPVASLHRLRPDLPSAVDATVRRALAVSPAARPDAATFADQLDALRGVRPRARRRGRRRQALLLAGGAAALLLAFAAGLAAARPGAPPVGQAALAAPAPAGPRGADADATLAEATEPATEPATGPELAEVGEALAEARRAWAVHDLARARERLDRVLALDARLGGAWLRRAAVRLLARGPDADEARADAERARALLPAGAAAALAGAVVASLSGRSEDARRLLEGASDPTEDPALRVLRGHLWERAGDHVRAVEAYTQALAGAPGFLTATFERGRSRRDANEAGAREDLEAVVAARGSDVEALVLLAEVRLGLDGPAPALELLDRALALDPRHTRALAGRAAVRRRAGDPRGALVDLERLVEVAPGAEVHADRARCHDALGDRRAALAELERALALDPRHVEAHVHRAHLRQDEGDRQGAREDFDFALAAEPGNARTLAARGYLRLEAEDFAGARDDLTRSLTIEPADPDRWTNLGIARLRLNDLDGAEAAYTRALELSPGHVNARFDRGSLRAGRGDLAGALGDLERVKTGDLSPEDGEWLRATLAELRARLGR